MKTGARKLRLLLSLALVLCGAISQKSQAAKASQTGPFVERIRMCDTLDGWAQAETAKGCHILHTTDGGQTWSDVTPHSPTNKVWDCQFPKPEMAWMSFTHGWTCRLLLTTNAGKSWARWTPLGNFPNGTHNYFLVTRGCHFFNANDGLAEDVDGAAGSSWCNFFETHNGGMTWKPVLLTPPGVPDELQDGAIPVSDMMWYGCDVTYYPPGRVVIVHGDAVEEKPKGVVCLSLSTNSGKSWRDLKLPVPKRFRGGVVEAAVAYGISAVLHFFDAQHALLPVRVFKRATNNIYAYNALLFYATRDGGNTWTCRPGALNIQGRLFDCHANFISSKDIFIQNGANLYITHNGAQSWHRIKLGMALDLENSKRGVRQMEFVDTTHGWMVVSDDVRPCFCDHGNCYPYTALYRTSNGGKTWDALQLKIQRSD